jgi:glycosyltransferase involved in cell wall biosynthesis
MYRVSEIPFDIIHCQHKPVTEYICKVYPDIPKICTIHSEVINLEEPFKHESIKEWIAIRPEIEQFLIIEHDIPEEQIKVIYNPIDNEKFQKSSKEENYLLFVGTVDYLRKATIFDLVEKTKENGLEFWIVGENKSDYLDKLIENPHVKYFPATWQVEKFLSNCKQTAGIQLGRTTIEGWISGKPGWIYRVDSNGDILDVNLYEPPTDLEKYFYLNVAKSIEKEYKKILIW